MGKSNKKVKSDRINALRKQYDAFLEEDKKRKERNEFILGRLDKMRYSTALVPIRHKPSTLDNRHAAVNHLGYRQEIPSVRELQSPLTSQGQLYPNIQNNEDTCLIQEISKKYILIPKLRSSLMNNYLQNVTLNQNTEMHPVQYINPIKESTPNGSDSIDWKSKYEILNILKNGEKEKQSLEPYPRYESVSEPNSNNKSILVSNQDQVDINYNNNINPDVHTGITKKCENEYPEKDLVLDTFEQNALKCNNEYTPYDIVHTNLIPNQNSYVENNKTLISNDDQDVIGYKLQNIELDAPKLTAEVTNFETKPEYHVTMSSTEADISVEQSVETNREILNVENEYSVEVDPAIDEHQVSVEQPKPADSDKPVYLDENEVSPIQVLNPEGLVNNINYDITEEEHLTQQSEPVIEQAENLEEITGSIADFEAEQGNMFYAEETDTDKQGDPAYNLDYSQNVYQPDQGYGYYEGTQNYPVGIQDEEVTQRYESTYEEQYGRPDEGLEQQPYQEIERVHLNQPELGQHYEHQFENPSQIEEMLDVEDHYVPQHHEAAVVETQHQVEAVPMQHQEEAVETQQKEDAVETQNKAEAVDTNESEKPDAEKIKASEKVYNN